MNPIIKKVLEEKRRSLLEPEAKRLCSEWKIPVPNSGISETATSAVALAKEIGYPVVLKIVSKDILHKTEVSGVLTNLGTPTDVRKGFDTVIRNVKSRKPESRIEGVLIEKMMPNTLEVIVGGLRDVQFGPAVMFGLGGIFAEIFRDVAFALAPVTQTEALRIMDRIKSRCLLDGYRGSPAVDRNALADAIVGVAKMMVGIPEISELDLNPVLAYESGACAVDARIMLSAEKGHNGFN